MSHGDGNVTRASESVSGSGGGGDEFGRAVARIAVAQVCEGIGFHGSKDSALEALADIAIRYLCDLGKTATLCANLTGRTECNVFDIVRATELLELTVQGFPGAAAESGRRCLAGSGVVRELSRFLDVAEEIPFAQPVPNFPVIKARALVSVPTFSMIGEDPPGPHVPPWLPALPDPHTYLRSPTWPDRRTDPREDKIEQIRQRRKAERSLFSLQQRLIGREEDSSVPNPTPTPTPSTGGKNPFLEPPLRAEEKEISPVVRPPKLAAGEDEDDDQGSSVLEIFGPAIEAVKNGFCEEDGEDESRLVGLPGPESRPVVRLKIRPAKKYLVEPAEFGLRKKDQRLWFAARDDERDDKKRRAEFILRQTMENPQELNQM